MSDFIFCIFQYCAIKLYTDDNNRKHVFKECNLKPRPSFRHFLENFYKINYQLTVCPYVNISYVFKIISVFYLGFARERLIRLFSLQISQRATC